MIKLIESNVTFAEALMVLYNNAKAQGMGVFQYTPENMTLEEATELLKVQTYFDYFKGRVMKVRMQGNEIDTRLYNRDNGKESAEKAIATYIANKA